MLNIVENNIEAIINLIVKAGKFVLNEQKTGNYQKYIKDDGSLVTELDYASNIIICNGLQELFGEIAIISEENEHESNIAALNNDHIFILDPIDGTKSFDSGTEFSINLAFCVNKKPAIGIIYDVRNNKLFFNIKNNAFVWHKDNAAQIMARKLNKFNIDKAVDFIGSKSSFNNSSFRNLFDKIINDSGLTINQISTESSMAKLASLIYGNENTVMFGYCNWKDWDVLPAIPILSACGINYDTLDENKFELNFNDNFNQGLLIASYNANNVELIKNSCQINKLPLRPIF